MSPSEIRDAIAEAVLHTLHQSKAMRALTTEEAGLLARAAAGNAAQVLVERIGGAE